MDHNFNPPRSKTCEDLQDARVVVNSDGRIGTISNVLPDAQGHPWSVHVKVDGDGPGAPPRILAVDEVTVVHDDFTGEIPLDLLPN